jgi:hypothetical protein
MFVNQQTASNELTTNFQFDDLLDNLNSDIFENSIIGNDGIDEGWTNERLTQSGDIAVGALPSSSSVAQSSSPFGAMTSEAKTEVQVETLEVQDAIDDTLLLDFDRPNLGSLEATQNFNLGSLGTFATQSLGGLYDDPIEYGDPLSDAYYWRQQQGANSCAVVAQICVYQSLTGGYISEAAASNYAQQQGWFDPLTGTPPQYTGHILDALGIPTYETYNATLSTLEYALAMGDKPIVGLDGNEIWNPQYDWFGNPLEQANAGHAVWVTGIDYESDGSIGIIINDSGTPNGMASVVDAYDFMNAWQDYNYFVSIADNPLT